MIATASGKEPVDRLDEGRDLRDSINGSLINVGVLAALMMALSGAIYTDGAPEPGLCLGTPALQAEMVIAWISMGLYFFSTIGELRLDWISSS